jgi:hypothetical protein
VLLKEERLPEGWEPRVRDLWGLTVAGFNQTVLRVELGVDEGAVVKGSTRGRVGGAGRVEEGEDSDEKA